MQAGSIQCVRLVLCSVSTHPTTVLMFPSQYFTWNLVCLLTRPPTHSLLSLLHSLTYSLPHSLIPSLIPSLTHSLTPSLTPSLTHSLPHSLTPSLPHSLTYSLPHSLPRSLTHSLTHSLIHPVCGTTGEGLSMSIEERQQVTEEWIKASRKRFCHFHYKVSNFSLS